MLIVDEISQVGGVHRQFGGIPIVIFFGDFFQFDPVRQTSLRIPRLSLVVAHDAARAICWL